MNPSLNELSHTLEASGLALDGAWAERLELHNRLVVDWQPMVSLVSKSDLSSLWERHTLDSLGFAGAAASISRARLVDVGSGGGFPGLALACLGIWSHVDLIERSERKAEFLFAAVSAIGLKDVEVRFGEFPGACGALADTVLTFRAVEKPDRLAKGIRRVRELPNGIVTSSDRLAVAFGEMFHVEQSEPEGARTPMFHVEHIRDAWQDNRWRRGTLYIVKSNKKSESAPVDRD